MGRIYLNDEWKFTEKYSDALLYLYTDESALVDVRLPHTCKEVPFNYFDENDYQMVCGYRRILRVNEAWKGKTVFFTCEGAGHKTTLYVNGSEAYTHNCGYTAFSVDISQYLVYGQANILVLKVDSNESLNQPPFGFVMDYMTFGGVYREVYLDVKENGHIQDAFVIAGPTVGQKATLECQVEVTDEVLEASKMFIRGFLTRKDTDRCPLEKDEVYTLPELVFEQEITKNKFVLKSELENIKNWHVDTPYLYELTLELFDEGDNVKDTYAVTTGFRSVEFRTDGFYLNGKKFKIRGLNRHQSYPYVGYAMPESMQKQDADILKNELGCNTVRTSHYPQSHHFINRCDEIGLLVFTEIPGWQHIGDDTWKAQACENVREMILQYRNHPSIMMWGVRINESLDDDAFYIETNRVAHELDHTRATGGVRNFKKSHLYEDVYTYNEFVHDGVKPGCEPKKNITSDMSKGFMVTEYNGHMYPTKTYDCEEHRLEHALRHARVLDAVAKEEDIAGCTGWCMFDYNTHRDFGSGDRICYHGVTDMFRNAKMAASVYASLQEETPILDVSASFDIGEHPACNLGNVYIFTNADSVKMYKNDRFIKEYTNEDSAFKGLKHGPILVDDFLGDTLEELEGFSPAQSHLVADAMNYLALNGYQKFPAKIVWAMIKAVVKYKMTIQQLVDIYTVHVGNWGGSVVTYRFDAITNGKVVKSLAKVPMTKPHLDMKVSHNKLVEGNTYDVASIRIRAVDENENLIMYFQEPVKIEVDGPLQIIGSDIISLKGGMGGLYVKTTGEKGLAKVKLSNPQISTVELEFEVV